VGRGVIILAELGKLPLVQPELLTGSPFEVNFFRAKVRAVKTVETIKKNKNVGRTRVDEKRS